MNSKIILAKNIKLDRNYVNVLNYTTEQMLALCTENQVAVRNDMTFIRKTNTIKVDISYNECLQSNYIAFQNPDYSNKWFFAWIDDVVYKGNLNTEISYTIDSWSTWWENWNVATCFVEREHVNDDTIGANTIQENIDIGDVYQEEEEKDISLSEYYYVAIQSAYLPDDGTTFDLGAQFSGVTVYNGQIMGTPIYLFSAHNYVELAKNLRNFIERTNKDKHIDDIENMFIVPDAAIDTEYLVEHIAYNGLEDDEHKYQCWEMKPNTILTPIETTIAKRTTFSDYTPRNNKLFTYPYNYLYLTNNNGSFNIYKYENFYNSNNVTFKTYIIMSIGCSGIIVPQAYKNKVEDVDEAIPLGKYPTCGWSADSFTNWLSKNALNEGMNFLFSFAGGLKRGSDAEQQVASYNSRKKAGDQSATMESFHAGYIISAAQSIASTLLSFNSALMLPNISGGTNVGDVNFASKFNTFVFRQMRAKTENLRIIDDFFDRFGYKINRVKVPNLVGRKSWNYVEIGKNEQIGYGSVPTLYMEDINNTARKGVTIWHNHVNIGNYNLDNGIIES